MDPQNKSNEEQKGAAVVSRPPHSPDVSRFGSKKYTTPSIPPFSPIGSSFPSSSPGSSSGAKGERNFGGTSDSESKRSRYDDVAASSMTQEVFSARFPFVSVQFLKGEHEVFQKFSAKPMDVEMMNYIIFDILGPRIHESSTCFGMNMKEIRFLPIWDNIVPLLVGLAPKENERFHGEKDVASNKTVIRYEVNTLSDTQGNDMQEEDSQETQLFAFSREVLQVKKEDGSFLKPRERVDYRVLARDKDGKEFTELVIDGKSAGFLWRDRKGECWKIGYYGCRCALDNVLKGKSKSIYVVNVAPNAWTLGVVDALGYVEMDLIEGKWMVVNEYFLRESEKPSNLQMMVDSHLAKMQEMKVNYNESFKCGDKYFVGNLYLKIEVMPWMSIPMHPRGFSFSTYDLFAGLLRVMIGDRVLHWSKETILELQARNQRIWTKKRKEFECVERAAPLMLKDI